MTPKQPSEAVKQELTAALETAAKNLQEACDLLKKFGSLEFESEDTKEDAKKKRKHKEKDPNAPKRPVSSYLYFCNDRRAHIKKEQPSIDPKEMVSLLGKEWQALDEAARKQWERKASEDKERYQKQLEVYKSGQDSGIPIEEDHSEEPPSKPKKAKVEAKAKETKAEKKEEATSDEGEEKEEKEHKKDKASNGEKKSKKDKEKKKSKKSKDEE
ncbi:hypothetical protein K450DRAFT_234834 [Umbelopsis ramanniana AG]|uniref:HMG box domain-containing protein n=1 Tax=Umbelopsis ramanniana AG TaxID=1314678 RepID=A0AAD5ECL9_UMBRA|nr:uncharacterized protein K450DRAFT_234834 [Umbelopsis ramanniana AG]KAI8580842.1 hypothetical protein K450DRAFT_234834 [Umbelopsis ramanniana AG]